MFVPCVCFTRHIGQGNKTQATRFALESTLYLLIVNTCIRVFNIHLQVHPLLRRILSQGLGRGICPRITVESLPLVLLLTIDDNQISFLCLSLILIIFLPVKRNNEMFKMRGLRCSPNQMKVPDVESPYRTLE